MEKKENKKYLSGLIFGIIIGMVIVLGIFAGIKLFQYFKTGIDRTAKTEEQESVVNTDTLTKMATIENLISKNFYGEAVTTQDLQDGVYKGMINALNDPYSEYYTKEELEDALNSNEGVSYGIGAYISLDKKTEMPLISGVMEESPALKAGLREGDIIYKVDDTFTQGLGVTKTVSLVKGREGTSVHLTIYREGETDYIEVDIERGKLIETATVTYGTLEDNEDIGYLRISEFDAVTVDQYTEAMAELKAKEIKGLILDLRSNPGGDLNAVVDIARKILPAGMIVYTEDKNKERKEYTCDGANELQMPLVVLVNEYSASASEILSGAIQDYNKGTLIGTTTFGKGIVQRIQRLSDGTAVKITVSAYFTPKGRNIHGVGIEPDISLEMDYDAYADEGKDNQLDKAIEVIRQKIG